MTNDQTVLLVPQDAQTAILPKQRPPHDDDGPRPDRWERPSISGQAPVVGGFAGRELALARLAWLLPSIAMTIVAALRLPTPALWADELASWGVTTMEWGDVLPLLQRIDAAIGPYYVLLFGWAKLFGTSEVALRLPSLLAMAAAAGMVGAIGSRLAGPKVGILGGLVFVALPTTSRYAQEVRPYALVVFAAALSTLLLVRALDRPRFWPFAGYAAAVALLGLTHLVALLLLAAHGLVVLVMRPRAVAGWVPAALVGAAGATPVLLAGLRQRGQVSWIPKAGMDQLTDFPVALLGTAMVAGAVLVLALLGTSAGKPGFVFTAWAVLPPVGLFIAARYSPLWLPRYLLFILPACALLAALSLGRLPLVRGLTGVALIAALAAPMQAGIRTTDGHGQATSALAATIASSAQPTDGIVYADNDTGGGWVGRDLVAYYVPPEHRPKDLLAIQPPRTQGRMLAVECPDIAACLGGTPRLWVVRVGTLADPLSHIGEKKERVLREQYVVDHQWKFRGLTLALLVHRNDTARPVPR